MLLGELIDDIVIELDKKGRTKTEDYILSDKYNSRIHKRDRIIALAFVKKWDCKGCNERLKKEGLGRLYSRNLEEFILGIALDLHLEYADFLEILKEAIKEYQKEKAREALGERDFFKGGVTINSLKAYLKSTKIPGKNGNLASAKATDLLSGEQKKAVSSVTAGKKSVSDAVKEKIDDNYKLFCRPRERARRIFCKYLCGYLENLILSEEKKERIRQEYGSRVFRAGNSENQSDEYDDFTDEMDALKKGKKTDKKEWGFSASSLFEVMDTFYCFCVCGDIDENYDRKELTYKKNYKDYINDIINGKRDISRQFLMLFLAFVNCRASFKGELFLDETTMNENCLLPAGFDSLDPFSDFDKFICILLQNKPNRLSSDTLLYFEPLGEDFLSKKLASYLTVEDLHKMIFGDMNEKEEKGNGREAHSAERKPDNKRRAPEEGERRSVPCSRQRR